MSHSGVVTTTMGVGKVGAGAIHLVIERFLRSVTVEILHTSWAMTAMMSFWSVLMECITCHHYHCHISFSLVVNCMISFSLIFINIFLILFQVSFISFFIILYSICIINIILLTVNVFLVLEATTTI